MTAAVGGAAQGGAEVLQQTNIGRVSPRGRREQSNSPDADQSQSEETQAPTSRSKENGADAKISRVEKGVSRRRGDDQSDEDEATFEDTFESVGKDATSEATVSPARSQPILPNLAMAQLLSNSEKAQGVVAAGDVSDNSQSAARPAPVLKQASILALMNTRDRLLSSSDGMKGGEATPEQSIGNSSGPTDRILATVDRRETHWNFDGRMMADAGAKVSELQPDAGTMVQAANVLGTALANAQKGPNTDPKETADGLSTAQTISTSGANLPSLTSGNNGSGAGANNGDQSSQQSQKSVNPELVTRRIGSDDTAAPLERVFSTDAAGVQASASATDQVRNGVIGSLTASEPNATAKLQQPEIPVRPANAVLRTLDLTLSPPDLGSVKLRMSLKDNALSIEAEASKASTAKLLGDDRVNLEKGLRDAGYDISSVKITDASASSSANSNNWQANSSPSRDGDQARSNSSGRQDGEMQRRDDGSSSDQAQRRAKDNRSQPAPVDGTNGKTGNAVYI